MKYVALVKLILSLLPVLVEAIRAVEDAIPGEGKGELKLAAIRVVLESAYAVSTDAVGRFDDLWPALQSTIAGIVTALNKAGVFKK